MLQCSRLLKDVFEIRSQSGYLHYSTASYARHMAFGEFYNDFYEHSDRLIELYIGKYKNVHVLPEDSTISILNIEDLDMNTWVKEMDLTFQIHKESLSAEDGDMAAVIDDIQETISKLRYKLLLESYTIPKYKKIF